MSALASVAVVQRGTDLILEEMITLPELKEHQVHVREYVAFNPTDGMLPH